MTFKEAFEAMKHGAKVKTSIMGRILVLVHSGTVNSDAYKRW